MSEENGEKQAEQEDCVNILQGIFSVKNHLVTQAVNGSVRVMRSEAKIEDDEIRHRCERDR